MLRTTTLILTTLCSSPLAACSGDAMAPSERAGEIEIDGPDDATTSVDPGGGWQAWVDAENERIAGMDPAFYDQVLRLRPQPTRNGSLRFTDPIIHRAQAAPILLHRLMAMPENGATRVALAEALPRTGGDFSAAAVGLMAGESDARVRTVLVGTMRRASPEFALIGLKAGLADESADVRAEAARTSARREDGAALAADLIAALGDEEVGTRTEAARALSALGVRDAVPALIVRLDDAEARVRLAALRAIQRIDIGAARNLDQLGTLIQDPDPNVGRVATDLASAL